MFEITLDEMIFVESVDRRVIERYQLGRMITGIYERPVDDEMRRIMPGQTVLLILIATLRKSDIQVHRGKNVADSRSSA